MTYLKEVSGVPGSGEGQFTFVNGAISNDLKCAQFFMTMQDRGASIEEMRSYANIGPMVSPGVDWDEVKRVLDTFEAAA